MGLLKILGTNDDHHVTTLELYAMSMTLYLIEESSLRKEKSMK